MQGGRDEGKYMFVNIDCAGTGGGQTDGLTYQGCSMDSGHPISQYTDYSHPVLQCLPGVDRGIFPGWQWRPVVGGDTPADLLPWNTSIPQCGNYHYHYHSHTVVREGIFVLE